MNDKQETNKSQTCKGSYLIIHHVGNQTQKWVEKVDFGSGDWNA